MKKKLLYNTRTKVGVVGLIQHINTVIKIVDKPKKMITYKTKISFKNYDLLTYNSIISGPIKEVLNAQGKITQLNLKYLLKTSSEINLLFKLNKEKYDFSNLIMDNIEDLYERIIKLHKITKKQFINKYGLSYMTDTYLLNESLFVTILSNIEAFNFKEYSEITDKLIITEIVKYFRSIN